MFFSMRIIRLFRVPVRFIILRSCCVVYTILDVGETEETIVRKIRNEESIDSKYCNNVISPS